MSDQTSEAMEEAPDVEGDIVEGDLVEGDVAEEVVEVRAPVHSLTEPVDTDIRSSILDSVLHPEEDVKAVPKKLDNKFYEKELLRLQMELVKLQEWVKSDGLRVVVIFEGRDAAGKGGVIKRITERLNPRVCRVAALGTATVTRTSSSLFVWARSVKGSTSGI